MQIIVLAVVLIVAIVLWIIPGTQALGAAMLKLGAIMALSGFIVGGIIGGIMSAVRGNDFWDGVQEGAVNGMINGFIAGAVFGAIGFGVKAAVKAANAAKAKPTAFSASSTNPQDFLQEALRQQGLKRVPKGGFKHKWSQDGFNFEVRVHAGNPQYTSAKQIFRVSKKAIGAGKSQIQYLGLDGVWYGKNSLTPTNPLFSEHAARTTHIPIIRR